MEVAIVVLLVVGILAIVGALVLGRSASDNDDGYPPPPPVRSGPRNVSPANSAQTSAASGAAKRRNWLVGRSSSVEGKTFHIGDRSVTMGRKVGNFIQLTDDASSRVHCRVEGTSQGFQVTDLGGAHGTYVNDVALVPNQPHLLANLDELRIGETKFVFYADADFSVNHGLTAAKSAAPEQSRATQGMGAVDWQLTLVSELERCNGDLALAARNLGMEPSLLAKLLEENNVEP